MVPRENISSSLILRTGIFYVLARIASDHKIRRTDACIQNALYVDIGGLPATEMK